MKHNYTIDVIAGDGIGLEVIPAAIDCVDSVAARYDFSINWRYRDWSSEYYRKNGRMMPIDGLDQLTTSDAILLGAVGDSKIDDTVTLWGLLIPIRRVFDQYVNLRPVKTLAGVKAPIGTKPFDLLLVRENSEGEYSEVGGRFSQGTEHEMAVQETIFTRRGIERITRYACSLAVTRSKSLVSATKSNGIVHTMPFWDEVVAGIASAQGIAVDKVLIDALAARFVLQPESLDVVVASNLFGDILSDLAAAIAGSIGIAPSANLNPERKYPSLFEPVHGSAPDIAGKGVANPIGAIWASAMMLDHLGESAAANTLEDAFETCLREGIATKDLGGNENTASFTKAVLDVLNK